MGYSIPEYLAHRGIQTSNMPRASQNIIDTGQGIMAEAIGSAAGQIGQTIIQQAAIAAEKQAVRDSVTLAEMQGQLLDFEFNSAPDIEKIQSIEDFKKQEDKYHKDWDRKSELLMYGKSRTVQEQFRIYTDLHRTQAKAAYANKRRPMERDYAKASIQKEWINRLKTNVGKPHEISKKHLQHLIEGYSGYLEPAEKIILESAIDKDVESFEIQTLINMNPDAAMIAIDKARTIDEGEKNTLRSQARSAVARNIREAKLKLQQDRENTMQSLLASVWDNELKDPQIITNFLKAGHLDTDDAKYLHEAIVNPDPPKTTYEAVITLEKVTAGIAEGVIDTETATKEVIKHINQLSPEDGKSYIKRIYSEHDTANAFWNRQSRQYIEQQIKKVSTLTGVLYGEGEQNAAFAKALIAFEQAKQDAIKAGKPLEGRDLLIKAHEVMLPFRSKPFIEGEKIPETLRQETPKEAQVDISRVPEPETIKDFEAMIRLMTNPRQRDAYFNKYKSKWPDVY